MKCTTDSGPFLINELNWNGANFFLITLTALSKDTPETNLRPLYPIPMGLSFFVIAIRFEDDVKLYHSSDNFPCLSRLICFVRYLITMDAPVLSHEFLISIRYLRKYIVASLFLIS